MCFFYCCFPIYCRILLFRFFPCFPLIMKFEWVDFFSLVEQIWGAFKYIFPPPLPIPYLPSALVCVYILPSAQSILLLCRCRILVLLQNSQKRKKCTNPIPHYESKKKKIWWRVCCLFILVTTLHVPLPDWSLCMDGGRELFIFLNSCLTRGKPTCI